MDKNTDFVEPRYYVAIGASAGGLEALQKLMQHMPEKTGCAFIIVQHLSPDFKSMMDELLSRQTKIPIFNAVDGQQVAADCIYLAPPRKNILFAEGRIQLADQITRNNFPIDIFFRALAVDQHHRSIAVVLSGTGSDGSRGIQAIKEVGGLVLVQEPSDAKFDGMPYCAIRTGLADVVMPADEIPSKIVQYITHPVVSGEKSALILDSESIDHALKEIYNLLREKSDIDFSCYKGSTVYRRIERRLGINGLSNVQEYYAMLLRDPRELQILSKDMLIGVTRFFRDAEAFEVLENKIIPAIFDETPANEPIRIWVAGCSSGEETYSIAMLFDEALQARKQARTIKIFATDVDPEAIAEASFGQFSHNISSDISEERLARYFTKQEEFYAIIPALRHMVVFATHNLLKDPPFSNCQLAVCRNVLIYFQPKAQRRILSMLHFALNKNGYMFLGSSESLGELQNYFETIDERNRLYHKVTSTKLLVEPMPPSTMNKSSMQAPSVQQLLGAYQHNHKPPQYLPVYERLIEDYVPACIVLGSELNVLHVFGNVEPYTVSLRAGRFSANIKDFIVENLQIAVTTALYRAQTLQQSVLYENVQFTGIDKEQKSIDLNVIFVNDPSMAAPHLAILFQERVTKEFPVVAPTAFDTQGSSQQLIRDLEEALRTKQEHLQVTVEELQTTNEELQSSNEELMAANEELQSTNEELQSVNEELYSVNSEYQEKIAEITQANQDIDNIINSADIAFIFLDDAMLIRRFSANAVGAINLLSSDIGRPFHHISHSLVYENFLNDISQAIQGEKTFEVEVMTTNREQKLVKISPYFDEHKVAMGCVISLNDITELRKLKKKLVDSWQELRSTLDTSFLRKSQKIRVLIVDDDDIDRESICRSIRGIRAPSAEYEVKDANDFESASALLESEEFDICIVDHNLRSHTGFELIKFLKERTAAPAFILLSGLINDELTRVAIELGIYDVLDKRDISPPLLEHSIRYTVRHRQTERFLSKQ